LSQTLIVFFKAPSPGKVKTRLAKDIGDHKACEVYRSLFSLTQNVCAEWEKGEPNRKVVYYGTGEPELIHSLGLFHYKKQYGKDLGCRMENAIREELHFADCVSIIGTDLPTISKALLEKAFKRLGNSQSIMGPATDGGFYLFGAISLPVNAFTNLSWSDESTLQRTCGRLNGLHCGIEFIETMTDIDSYEDLKLFPDLMQ
jgi:uncharacterized protein